MILSSSPSTQPALRAIPIAIGVAAIALAPLLQAAIAQATPPPELPSPTWTVALAVDSPVASSYAGHVALRNTTLGNTARWATVIGQIQPQDTPACCFSDLNTDLDTEKIGRAIDETLTQNQIYILLVLTLWFGATAPWVLQQFWLSQQRLAYGREVNPLRGRRSAAARSGAARSGAARSGAARSGTRAASRSQRYRAVPLHSTQMPQRFARPRVVPVVRPQDWEVDRRPSHRTGVEAAPEVSSPTVRPGRSQSQLQPAAVC
ncbi:MAG: hypothetical protein HC771_13250 [Synechococcales cyanobacterium CRU_2_2]|nr:hypothetical protein [Synechococcales cyanobacterium CRU_2_2]